jgi:hypothetical protein
LKRKMNHKVHCFYFIVFLVMSQKRIIFNFVLLTSSAYFIQFCENKTTGSKVDNQDIQKDWHAHTESM